MKLAA
jgi:hypothetical protein